MQKSGLREAQTSGRHPPLSAGRLQESSARSSWWLPRTQCLEAAARPGPLPRGWWRLRHRRFPPPAPASTEGRSMARQPAPTVPLPLTLGRRIPKQRISLLVLAAALRCCCQCEDCLKLWEKLGNLNSRQDVSGDQVPASH